MSEAVFPNFPYERKFTKAEIAEITEEAEKLADAMRDGVAPNGAVMYLEESMLQMWCVHGALAGVRVQPEKARIVAVKIPDATGQFADSVEWKLRADLPDDHDEQEASAEASKIADALKSRLTDSQRAQVAQALATGFEATNPEDAK